MEAIPSPVRIDRAALRAFVEQQCDLIERTPVPTDVLGEVIGAGEEVPAMLDPVRLWRIAGLATLVGLSVYEDAERFIAGGVT